MTIQKIQISSPLIRPNHDHCDRKTAASPPSDAAARLREGGSLLARLCSLVTALGLEEGSDETRPHVEEYVGWLQVPSPSPPFKPPRCARLLGFSLAWSRPRLVLTTFVVLQPGHVRSQPHDLTAVATAVRRCRTLTA